MTYRFYYQSKNMLCTRERHSGSKVLYYNRNKMNDKHSNGNYEVIGEIGNFHREYFGQDEIVTETGEIINIFPRGSCKKPFEWVAGYAPLGENTYVAVIKSIIPRFNW